MRKIFILFFISAVFLYGNFTTAQNIGNKPAVRVIAYYFHGDFRCSTCHAMEQYSKEAIETNFKDALAAGNLELKVINVEEPGNEHFTKDYQLYTRSLILSLVRDGKEIRSKNLTKIWEYVRNKEEFIDYVCHEVRGFLEEAK